MVVATAIRGAVGLVHPIAILNLLRYLETNGENATIRPWYVYKVSFQSTLDDFNGDCSSRFWVLTLFLKSFVETTVAQRYLYLVVRYNQLFICPSRCAA